MRAGPRSRRAPLHGPGPPPRTRLIAIGSLILIWVAFTYPFFTGKVHFPTDFAGPRPVAARGDPASNPDDGDAYFALYPWHTYLGQQLRAGHLPLWDPTRFVGTPFAANPGVGSLYPPNWLYATGDTLFVETLIWAVTILASLLLAYWFLRVLRLHPYAAALGALAWTCSGFMLGWSTHDPVIGAAVWLPLALGGIEVARQGKVRRGIPLAGLGLALSILAGHGQITLYVWLAVAIWALVSGLVSAAGAWRGGIRAIVGDLARAAGPLLGAFVIGAGFASVQILGAVEFSHQIARQTITPDIALVSRLLARAWPTALIPDYLGNPLHANYAGAPPTYTQTTFYAGVLILPLAVAGLLHRNRRASLFFGLLLTVGVLASFGTPFYRALFGVVPGLSRTAAIARFIFFVDVGLAGLAALGLDAVLRPASRVPAWTAIGAAALEAVTLASMTLVRWGTPLPAHYINPRGLRAILLVACGVLVLLALSRHPAKLAVGGLLIVGLTAADLWIYGFPYHPFQTPRTMYPAVEMVDYLASVDGARPRFVQTDGWELAFNSAMVYGLYGLNGYDVYIPQRFTDLLTLADPSEAQHALQNFIWPIGTSSEQAPILDLLGVRNTTAPPTATGPGTLAYNGSFAIFNQAGGFPPAFVATCWDVTPDVASLDRLRPMTASRLRTTVVVSGGPDVRRQLGASPAGCLPGPPATVQTYEPQKVVVTTEAGLAGVLVLTDQWYPGWTVSVDGRPATMLLVDHALRGVAFDGGAHTVTFRFQPHWPAQGLAIMVLTLDLVLLLVTAGRQGRVPAPRPAYAGRGTAVSSTPSMPSTDSGMRAAGSGGRGTRRVRS